MPTYIVLANFTDQGIRGIKETTKRAQNFREMAKKLGISLKEIYWMLGQYDFMTIAEAPDEGAMTALGLSVGALGNVRTNTMRAFTADEMGKLLARLV